MNSNWNYSPETPNLGQNRRISLNRVTLQVDGWHWKIIGYLFYATSNFVHHFVAIGEYKLELQSGNAAFESKSTIFLSVWLCNLTDGLEKLTGNIFYATPSFVHHFVPIGELKPELQSGNAQFGSNSMICLAVWPWNLTDDHEKQQGPSPKHNQA